MKTGKKSKMVSIGFCIWLAISLGCGPAAAADIGFGLRGTDLNTAGNTGPVSFIVQGAGLTSDTTISVVDAQGNSHSATKVVALNDHRALVTVDLGGAAPGSAALNATQDGAGRQLADALQIEAGKSGQLDIRLDTPPEMVAGQTAPILVSYANTGQTDIDIPLLVLSANGADYLGRKPEGNDMGQNAFILAAPDGPVNTSLRPGEQVSIPFFVRWENPSTGTVSLAAVDLDDSALAGATIDYEALTAQMPDPGSQATVEYISALQQQYGGNLADFYQHETQQLQDMTSRLDRVEMQSAQNINGRWHLQEKVDTETMRPEYPERLSLDLSPLQTVPPHSTGGDGITRTYAIVIGINDYDNMESDKGDLAGCVNDATMMYDYLRYNLQLPADQITYLTKKYGYDLSITEDVITNSILNSAADADDNLVLFFAGHGSYLEKTPGSDELVGALCTSETSLYEDIGYLRTDELSAVLTAKNAGNSYVILDACHSGTFVDEITSPRTAVFAATQASETTPDAYNPTDPTETQGFWSGMYAPFFTYYLRQGYSLEEAHNKAKLIPVYYGYNNRPVYSPDSADVGFPFGSVDPPYADAIAPGWGGTLQEAVAFLVGKAEESFDPHTLGISPPEDLIQQWNSDALQASNGEYSYVYYDFMKAKMEEWQQANGRPHLPAARAIAVVNAPAAGSPGFSPGGLAVSRNYRLFYLSDNSNGRILMLNPNEPKHRLLTLVSGLSRTGDVDLADGGRSLAYVANSGVQRTFFGLSAYIHDAQRQPLAGALAVLEGGMGPIPARVDSEGYVTFMDLLKPSLADRRYMLTIQYGGNSQVFPITLKPTDQTFVKIAFSGDPLEIKPPTYDQNSTWAPEPVYEPGPGDGDTGESPLPVTVPVEPGTTSIVPTIPVYHSAPPSNQSPPVRADLPTGCGSTKSEGPDIAIVTPMDNLQASSGNQVLSGIVCDSSVSQITVNIDGTDQTVAVTGGQFSLDLTLGDGSHSIQVSGTNDQGFNGSESVSMEVDSSQPVTTGAVTGFIVDQYGYPVVGTPVFTEQTGQKTTTDQHGLYRFSGVNNEQVTIQAQP